ncbi:MAG: hypothetical protein IKS71_02225 [Bacteroidales bacterium]|nr:hypothetical protein [Bacteroidales bacterium]
MVKVICVSAWRCNVIVIIYAVVSNHCHVAILAVSQEDADKYARDIKKVYSMWFSRKYGERNILKRIETKAILLDSDWYVRNALAYIPRNALDNGRNVNDYEWSGYRAMFADAVTVNNRRKVSLLNARDRKQIMHTGDKLERVPWLIDAENHLIPSSICDHTYLEQAFNNNQSFFLKTIGALNVAEISYDLEERPYKMVSDAEMQKSVDEIAQRWFGKQVAALSMEQKNRLVPYVSHIMKTTPKQLCRVFELTPERMDAMLRRK